jgi:hypothetical protein
MVASFMVTGVVQQALQQEEARSQIMLGIYVDGAQQILQEVYGLMVCKLGLMYI